MVIRYYASNMILVIDSNVAYLVILKARSRIAGYYQLIFDLDKAWNPILNKVILVECKTLCYMVSLVADAKIVGIFYNTQIAILIWHILEHIRYLQLLALIKTNNLIVMSFINNNIY